MLVLRLNLYLTCYQLLDTIFLVLLHKSISMFIVVHYPSVHISTIAVFHIYHHITVILAAIIELDGRVTAVRSLVLRQGRYIY